MGDGTGILSLRNLSKSYGDLAAVRDLSLDVHRGEIFGLLGPNGAGKTTTINMICGLLKSDSGEIWIDGCSATENYRACKRMIGLCPQELVIWESLTCLEQLEFIGRQYDLRRDEARTRALNLLDLLGLASRRNDLAKTLSGGMKRRLNLALALVHDPEILILDEPQAGLDPQSRILVREYIRSAAERMTVVLTTHDMDEADRLVDRVAIIDHGQLLVLDTPEALKDRMGEGDVLEIEVLDGQAGRLIEMEEAVAGDWPGLVCEENVLRCVDVNIQDALPALLNVLQSNRIQIHNLVIRKKTLEDVFIALTGRRLRE